MPHEQVGLNGPGIYVGIAILAIVVIGGIAIIIDAFRRPRYHFGRFGAWGYVAFVAFYFAILIAMLVIRFTGLGAKFAGQIFLLGVAWTFLTGIIEIIYLLGVVFPDDKDRKRRAEYEQEHGLDEPSKTAPASHHDSQNEGYFDD